MNFLFQFTIAQSNIAQKRISFGFLQPNLLFTSYDGIACLKVWFDGNIHRLACNSWNSSIQVLRLPLKACISHLETSYSQQQEVPCFMTQCLFMILFYIIIIKAQWSSRREAHWLASCNYNEALELEFFPETQNLF